MPNNSLLRLCFVISLCVHFSLGFIPFFTTLQAHHSPVKFVEVVFLKNKEKKPSLENKKAIPEANSDSLRASSIAADVSITPRVSENLKAQVSQSEERSYNETNSDIITVVERLELDLTDLEDNNSLNLLSDYAHVLRSCILNKIIYPKTAFRKNREGTVQLKFILLPDGNLKEVYIVKSSNCLILDAAAISAIEKANPFPPFPKSLRTKELFVKVPIIYRLN